MGRFPKRRPADSTGGIAAVSGPDQVEIISRRGVVFGVILSASLIAGMFLWRLASRTETIKKLVEFEFSVEEPEQEEFDLKEPMRDILQEQQDRLEEVVEVEEQPDIQMTVLPTDVDIVEEFIHSKQIDVQTPDIEVEAQEVDIDAPEQITEVTETVEFAVDVIAANAPGPADIFTYDKPNPPDKPQTYILNRAPQPSHALKVLPQMFGDQESLAMGELGPMSVNLFGSGDFFRAMTRMGGMHARSAVDAALHWLAIHQETDGHWNPKIYEGGDSLVGSSGLALMAFMGGGHTTRRGEYRRQVMRGLEWLMQEQQPDGKVGSTMYEHAIATIAFCEAFGRGQDERVVTAARRSVVWIEKAQNMDGGWRYHPNSQQSDVSVTAWVIQALKAAKLAQIKFDHGVYARSLLFIDALTDKGAGPNTTGAAGYTYEPSQNYGHMPAMTCAAMVIRQFSGSGVKSLALVKAAELTRSVPPDWNQKNFYLWYYATYAMHNMGEEDRVWWNRRIRDVLVENQSREGDNAGSWDPKQDRWAQSGGRIYTTALGALCLEVYYRYSDALNSFGVAPDIDDLFTQ